ncbi:MAG: ABC transporter permease [Saprospiraceae bacterium]|nr:ABC transporter permease [Saprospiraceae bacterium]MBP6568805.1 ABC transporter permease [Saprospiraceae bacterium]
MIVFFKIVWESLQQALGSLRGNKLRTFLSLLGITIGIFCIITVKSAVDSLQANIVQGFNELGSDVIYLDKMPWNEDPGENYWKYAKRPDASYEDYTAIKKKSKLTENTSYTIFTGGRTVKHLTNSVSNAFIMGSTFEYASIQNLKIAEGRYFSTNEYETGANKVILGYKVYNELFKSLDGIGREVKLFGQDFQVIGYMESEGDNAFNFLNFDDVIWMGFNTVKKYVNVKDESTVGRMLNVKAVKGTEMAELKGEIASIIRSVRRLKPMEGDNFALNELSMLAEVLDKVFSVLNIAGFIIGIFALVVGMFSVANIMFVSVKERTSIIGIKKALGAKRYIILMEFLIEAIILCIIGGLIGLTLVFIILKIISMLIPFAMTMSLTNMAIGVFSSIIVGIISGILPALQASGMDPVEAIRA